MKEELKSLKQVTIEIVKAKEQLRKQKIFFNMKVEEKKLELNTEEFFKEYEDDSFEAADLLNFVFPQIHSIVSSVKEQHPKYGEKRIKEITSIALKEFMTSNNLFIELIDKVDLLVDNYFLYESCGYFKLLEKQKKINKLEESAKNDVDSILNESKESAKNLVNLGSKKLIKILNNIENKTKKK